MQKVKAIVIADDHYNALGMVRSLGIARIDVTLILFTQGDSFVDSSKYVTKCIKISHSSDELIKHVNRIIESYSDSLIALFPLNDFSSQVLDQNISLFPSRVLCPNANGNILKLSDKYYIKEIVSKCGFTVPNGELIDFRNMTEIKWTQYPAIIKPVVSIEGSKRDITIVNNVTELNYVIKEYIQLGYKHALIEEYITGPDSHMVEVMGARNNDSSIDYAGIIRKIREYPIKNGSTSYAKIVDQHVGIDFAVISKFLDDINYVGIFDIEYKYANGKAYFIECNFRNGAPGFIFTLNGHNIPELWIKKNFGLNFKIKSHKLNNINFMVEQNDLINMLKGEPIFSVWIKQYISACKIFSFRGDSKPVRKYYLNFIIDQLKGRLKKYSNKN